MVNTTEANPYIESASAREPDSVAIYRTDLVQLRIPETSDTEPPAEFIANYPGLGSITLDSAKAKERFGLTDQEVLVAALSLAGASLTQFAADFGYHSEWLTASKKGLFQKLGASRMTVAQEVLLRSSVTHIAQGTNQYVRIGHSYLKILETLRFTGSVPDAIEYAGLRLRDTPQSGKHHYMELQSELLDLLGVRSPLHAIPVAYLQGVIHKWGAMAKTQGEPEGEVCFVALEIPDGSITCAAAALRRLVDRQLNGGAIAEADAATDELQDVTDEPSEYKVYSDDGRDVRFRPQDYGCAVCSHTVQLSVIGGVNSSGCKVSGDCEVLWAERNPRHYLGDDGALSVETLPCAAEGCKAILDLRAKDSTLTITLDTTCRLTDVGIDWMVRAGIEAAGAKVVKPEDGIPEFDGQPDPDSEETPSA